MLPRKVHQNRSGRVPYSSVDVTEARKTLNSALPKTWKHGPRNLVSEIFRRQDLPPPEIVVEAYERTQALVDFANLFELDRQHAIKALAAAGIDIHRVVALEWKKGCTVRELSNRHAVTRQTIVAWIKKGGGDISPRNGNRKHDEALIVAIFDATKSANKAAQTANVHWTTARRVLKKYNRWHES